jgi:hypothetical protein
VTVTSIPAGPRIEKGGADPEADQAQPHAGLRGRRRRGPALDDEANKFRREQRQIEELEILAAGLGLEPEGARVG